MTIAAGSINTTYNGTGSLGPFSFSWPIQTETDITVVKTIADGSQEALELGTHYSIAGVGSPMGGSVTMLIDPINEGEQLTINSTIPYEQSLSIRNQGAYYPDVLEDALDRLSIQIKQVYALATGTLSNVWTELVPSVVTQVALQIRDFFTGAGDTFAKDYGTNAAAINAALVAIGGASRRLVITAGNWTIDADVVIPANVALELRTGAVLVGDGVHTLTINGKLNDPGERQIFSGLSVTGLSVVRATWFGTADYGASINAANACVPAGGGTITLPAGTLPLYTLATINKPNRLLGEGVNVTVLQKKAAVVGIVWNNLVANGGEIAGFTLNSDNVGVAEDGIQVTAGSRLNMHDLYVTNQKGSGIVFQGNNNLGRVERVIAVNNGLDGIFVNGGATHDGNAMSFQNIDARGNGRDGVNLDDAIDGFLLGVSTQSNGRYGIRVNSRGNYIIAYSEVNATKDYEFTAASSGNYLVATNGTPEDLGTANIIVRNNNNALYRYTMENQFIRRMLEFRDQATYVGYWQTAISADRTLTTTFAGSSSAATKKFTHASYPTASTTLLADILAAQIRVIPNNTSPNCWITTGSGSPNGSITGYPGCLYLNTAGGATASVWVKESGSGTNTGWVAK